MSLDATTIISNYDSTLISYVRENNLDPEVVAQAIEEGPTPKEPKFIVQSQYTPNIPLRDFTTLVTCSYNAIPVTAKTVDLEVTAHGVSATLTIPFQRYQLLRALANVRVRGAIQRRVRDVWLVSLCTYYMSGRYEAPKLSDVLELRMSESFREFVEEVLEVEHTE